MAAPGRRHPAGFACVIFRFLSSGFLTPFARTAPCFLGNGAFSPRRPSWTRARKSESVPSQTSFHISGPFVPLPGVSRACTACRQAFQSGVFSEYGFTCYFPQQGPRQRATATLPRALLLREVEPGREQSGGWMSGRVFPPLATTDLRGDGIMQTATAPGASSRTFLIHMFMRGLDDNRYVVERYKSTFDGEIVRWPCKGKSKTGKQPRQIMSLGAVQRMRPERDEIIVCTGVKIAGSGIQYWGSAATGLFAERRRKGR